MVVSYPISLEVKEPNNDIGILRIRQSDEESQTLVVQVLEYGLKKSYEGLQIFFCAKLGQTSGLGIIEQKLLPSEMTDPKNGKFEYTMRAEDWQQLGHQTAYFSFRKMKDDHTYVQQFSTRDFTYEVTKNIYSDGIKEVTKDGSTYVWTFEDLLRLLQEFKDSGETDFLAWFDEIKDQLSEDAAGNLMLLYQSLRDKTGSDNDFRPFESELSFMKRVYNEAAERAVNVKWLGADSTGQQNSDQAKSEAEKISNKIYFPDGKYSIPKFQAISNIEYIGANDTTVNLSHQQGESVVLLGFGNDTTISNIHFKSNEENLEWNRGDLTGSERVSIHDCVFEGFRHTSNTPNSWGLYLEHSKDIRITNCDFFDNTQSDIAILDGCENIVIDSCFSSKDTLHINFEPNTSIDPIRNVVLKNMKINKLSLLNNSLTNDGVENLLIENCDIEVVEYRGLDVTFINCKVNKINGINLNGNLHAGNINLNDSLPLTQNLLTDPYLESYASVAASNAEWLSHYATAGLSAVTTRHTDAGGKTLRIGTRDSTAQACTFKPKMTSIDGSKKEYTIDVSEGDTFVLTIYGSASYPTGSVWISLMAGLLFMDSSGNTIPEGNIHISMFRAPEGNKTGYKTQTAVITIPSGVSKLQLKIGPSKASTLAALFVGAVSLQKVVVSDSDSNIDFNPRKIGEKRVISNQTMPNTANGWGHFQPGDICYNSVPTTGQPIGWICTESGYPGVWKSMGNLN